jgi:hypothetical protein
MKETSNDQLFRSLLDGQIMSKCYSEKVVSYNVANQYLAKKMLLGEPLRAEIYVSTKNLDRLNDFKLHNMNLCEKK